MANAPMTTMAELAKQNLDYWTRMQDSMTAAFKPGARGAEPAAPAEPAAEPGGEPPPGGPGR
jgi:hypothetical protein